MSSLTCPRCPGLALDRTPLGCLCRECEGCWFGFEQFEKVLRLSEFELHSSEIEPTLVGDTERVSVEALALCPQCQLRMKRHIYMVDSDVTIDMCREHGMWLDDGELMKIRDFLNRTRLEEPKEPVSRGLFSFFRRVFGGSP